MRGQRLLGTILILIMLVCTAIGLVTTPHSPTEIVLRNRLIAPNGQHWLGTDHYGRDILSRIMVGGRTSLFIGIIAVLTGLGVGTLLGAMSGFYGKLYDELLMRIADGMYAFPPFLLALLAVTLWGPGQNTVLVAIAIGNVPVFMRLVRASVLQAKQSSYVEAARAVGASDSRILIHHILPDTVSILLLQGAISFAAAVLAEASLSYLGVGVQPPALSWGRMLREAQPFSAIAPWVVVFPGLSIMLTVLGFNLMGDGKRGGFHKN